jgi:drug/metabolite transporter (DMT)-like permease
MDLSQKKILAGIFYAALSVLCWSTAFPVASALLQQKSCIDPVTLTAFRFLIGGSAMLLCYTLFTRRNPAQGMTWREWRDFAFHGIFTALMSLLLFKAQETIPVVNASMLEAEAPLVMFVLGILIHRTKNSFLQITGLLLGFTGCLMVLNALNFSGLQIRSLTGGDLLVFASASCWAFYTVLARKTIQKVGGFLYSAWSLLSGGIWVTLYALTRWDQLLFPASLPAWLGALHLALITTALAFFAWNNAQNYISIGLLSISGYFTPAFAALLGWSFFGEKLALSQICGMGLVLFSALIEPAINELLQTAYKRIFSSGAKEDQH